ncbi:MAG: hypothetical protein KAR42_07970 [candidate division Zixibacteria bacterium]|nr:hypothetical protein [candidate division Zixibacteria bacterium]
MLLRLVSMAFSLLFILMLFTISSAYSAEDGVISTACKSLRVYNSGLISNNTEDASLDYIDDCDTFSTETNASIYLNVGTPIVARFNGVDTLIYHMYDTQPGDSNALIPLSDVVIDSISDPAMVIATCEFITADSSIGCILEYFAPTAPDTCEGIVQRFRFYNNTDETQNNVALGYFLDWDVPSDSGRDNTSGDIVNPYEDMIYQQGFEYDNDTNGDCGQLENDRFAGIISLAPIPRNAMTLDNATWVYDTGPFGAEAPLPAGAVYNLMRSGWLFSQYSSPDPDSIAVDLSTLITFNVYRMEVSDTIDIIQVISTGKSGVDDFHDELLKTRQWAVNNSLYNGYCCIGMGGDANNDGSCNLGDAVFLISYAFKGGQMPPCLSEGDANTDGSVNVGDGVYIIGYCFKGGPTPDCGGID